MSREFVQLLDATIDHLERLRADGVEFVPVKAATLAALTAPAKAASNTAAPAARKPAAPATPTPVPQSTAVSPRPQPQPAAPVSPILPISVSQPAESPSPAPTVAPVDTLEPLPPRLEGAAKSAAIQSLRERVLPCTRCPNLVQARKSVVFGVGDIDARLMFVGEAPGADEDAQGEPFVGAAGQKLNQIIQATGLSRAQVFIANVLKCRPDTPGQAFGNRKPTSNEMATCLPYLQEQMELIQPEVIVALGATAMEGLFGEAQVFITKARGKWRSFRGIPVMPTYHPSYILRNQALAVKRQVWEDMLAVMERLGMPISPKQRSFFLPPP